MTSFMEGWMQDASWIALFAFVISFATLVVYLRSGARQGNMDNIPTVGCTGNSTFYIGALKFLLSSSKVLASGYSKYNGSLFKIAVNYEWQIVVSSQTYLRDLLNAPESIVSVDAANKQRFQVPYTLGDRLFQNGHAIRGYINQMTRDVDLMLPPMIDEVRVVLGELSSHMRSDDVKLYNGLDLCTRITRQVNTRVFLGPEKARDLNYLNAVVGFPRKVMLTAIILNWTPPILKTIVAFPLSVLSEYREAVSHVLPVMEVRKHDDVDFASREYDTLSRILQHGQQDGSGTDTLAFRFMMINFAAMHSSIYTLCHNLFYLATMPDVARMLREEIQEAVSEHGWTKASFSHMKKLDSFLRETQRVSAISSVGTMLKVVRPFTFSDGTLLHPGSTVIVPISAIHEDDAIFPDAKRFDPLRFFSSEEDQVPYTRAGLDFVAWGFGKHTCPGRFYASTLLKCILAHLILRFDIQIPGESKKRPRDFCFEANRMPNPLAKIELRHLDTEMFESYESLK